MTNGEKLVIFSKKQQAIRQNALRVVETDPTFPIKIGGKEFQLEFTYGPVSRIFKKTGVNVNLVEIDASILGDPEVFETILREGLRRNHPDIAIAEDLMDHLALKHMQYYRTCIQLALTPTEPDPVELAALLDQIEKEVGTEQEAPLQDGSTSAGSGDAALPEEYDPAK